ncbi:MAG: T9SS type A sorting domain-containing protein [Bacteroidales bacterium]|nr:T9SS type A sorting domain-containing protein [Bacteroidales bacterium]
MKKIILILTVAFLMLSTTSNAQLELWGMTSEGGEDNYGTIFKTDVNGNNYSIEHSLLKIEGMIPDYTELCEAGNGKLYGMTSMGGTNNSGVIFEYNPNTNTYTIKKNFTGGTDGKNPHGSLIQADNGKLYGMTSEGGINNYGVIFEYDLTTDICIKKIDFNGIGTGRYPQGSLMQADNGKLYGMTKEGGANNLGVIFEYDPGTGTYTKKFDFDGTNKGNYPYGNLIQADNGKIYGMTSEGGINDYGIIFEYNLAIDTCIKKIDFDGTNTGKNPYGSLMQADNGKIYGMTCMGGTNNSGVIFDYSTETGICIKKFDFNNLNTGRYPLGSLMQADNGKIYGTTKSGGTNNYGVLFEYDHVTDICIKKLDFNGTNNGSYPNGRLMQASNGKIYGTTKSGGADSYGVFFEYEPDTDTYTKKINFNGTNGSSPAGSLIQASDGKFYGMTERGGINDYGVIFEYDPATGIYTKKFDFDDSNTGSYPLGSLMQASNKKLYGMTSEGGTNYCGVLFEYDPITGTYTKKLDFDDSNTGDEPYGSLMQASNGKLYGMTKEGGTSGKGVLFEYDPVTSIYTKKIDFDGTNGYYPWGSLMQASNGKIYGTTYGGGTGGGVIFEYDPITNIYTKKFDFSANNGAFPYGSLIQANNGNLYGMANYGGTNDCGVLFEYNPETDIFTKKLDFDGTNGDSPYGSLTQASNGKLYGMTTSGGTSDKGVLFEYVPATGIYTKKLDFDGTNGSEPYRTSLIEICPAKLTSQDFTICDGDSILVNGKYLYSAGTYYDTLSTCCGSDSVVVTDLTVNPVYNITETAEICDGNIYTWEGSDYTISGTYAETYATVNGCDSIRELVLTVNPVYNETDAAEICEGDSYTFGTQTLTTAGEHVETFESVSGCDSIVTLTLTVNPAYNETDVVEICEGSSYTFGTQTLTEEGEYVEIFESVSGCDSLVTLTLTVNPVYNITETAEICNGNVYTWEGSNYTEAGEYIETLETVSGCDSVVTLTLTIFTVDASVTVNQSTLTANATGTYQWIDCSNNQAISDETNQSFTPAQTGDYAVEVTQNSCIDTSSCYNIVITSIAENNFGAKITVYPNPACGFVNIELPEFSESYRVTLIDMLGRVLLEDDLTGTSKQINLSTYTNGLYVLTVYDVQNKILKSFKIIKK